MVFHKPSPHPQKKKLKYQDVMCSLVMYFIMHCIIKYCIKLKLLYFLHVSAGGCYRRGVQWWQPASQKAKNGFRRQLSKLWHLQPRVWVGWFGENTFSQHCIMNLDFVKIQIQPSLVPAWPISQQRTWRSTSGLQMRQESITCCRSRSASIWESHPLRGSTRVRTGNKCWHGTISIWNIIL